MNPEITNREWGILIRLLMNSENSVRNSIGDGEWDGFDVWARQQRKRAEAIRKLRLKLSEQRKAAK